MALLGCSGWLYSKCLAAWLVGWAALTIGLGGAEAPGPDQGRAPDWLWSRLTGHRYSSSGAFP